MKIMFVASEFAPLAQSGGLGDAVSGLARALGALGHEVTCVLPAYRQLLQSPACPRLGERSPLRLSFHVDGGGFDVSGRMLDGNLFPGVDVAAVDFPSLYDRPGLYGYGDDGLRFVALARAAAYFAEATLPIARPLQSVACLPDGRIIVGSQEDELLVSYDDGRSFEVLEHAFKGAKRNFDVLAEHQGAIYAAGSFQHLLEIR